MKGSNTTRKGVLTYRPGISRVPAKGHHVVQSLSLGCHVIRCAREQRVWDGVRQLSFVHQERVTCCKARFRSCPSSITKWAGLYGVAAVRTHK